MNFLDVINSNEEVYMFRNRENKIQFIPKQNIASMIGEIATGPLSNCSSKPITIPWGENKSAKEVMYKDDHIKIIRQVTGIGMRYNTYHSNFYVYYNTQLVYPGSLFLNTKWIPYLFDAYKKHNQALRFKEEQLQAQKNMEEKREKLLEVFRFFTNTPYEDDKIRIYDCKVKVHYDSYGDPESYEYQGKISLESGIIVCDTYNRIYHPGKWVDYVLALLDSLLLEENSQRLLEEQERKRLSLQRRKKVLEEQRRKTCPIDDSALFD